MHYGIVNPNFGLDDIGCQIVTSRSSKYVALYFTGLICQDHPEAYLPTSNIWVNFWEAASALVEITLQINEFSGMFLRQDPSNEKNAGS